MKVASYGLAVVLLVASAAAQQTPGPGAATASISGSVVNAEGQALRRASVALRWAAGLDDVKSAITDEKGRFAFTNLKPGLYFLRPEKRGYAEQMSKQFPGSQVQVPAGEQVKGVLLKMYPAAVIRGHVVDENGEPMEADVFAFFHDTVGPVQGTSGKTTYRAFTERDGTTRYRASEGTSDTATFRPVGRARPDDRGEFHLYGLPPGYYYVTAAGSAAGGKTYLSMFYPAVRPLEDAAALQIKPGDELWVNFTMQPARPAREAAVAQPSLAVEGKPASISGRVASSDGLPLSHAMVILLWSGGGTTETRTTVAGEDGRFEFTNLKAGHCSLGARRTGYAGVAAIDGAQQQLSSGEHVDGVLLKLQGAAAITGRVVDENGEPMEGAEVTAYPQSNTSGTILRETGSMTTDDRGEFRIHSLPPGEYCVRASTTRSAGPGKVYPPTYYPGTLLRQAAVGLPVRPGDELRVNFTMEPAGGVTVRGHVRAPAGSALSVSLEERESVSVKSPFEVGFSRPGSVRANGSFEVKNVPPGKYVVIAVAPTALKGAPPWEGRASVDVANEDVEGVDVALGARPEVITIKGSVRCECPPGATITNGTLSLQAVPPPIGRWTQLPPGARFGKELTFTLQVPTGTWRIFSAYARFSSPGEENAFAQFKSASLGDKDVTDAEIRITRGMAGTPLEIVLSGFAPRINGIVLDSHDKPVANASVVGVPEDGFNKRGSMYLGAQTNPQGEFSIRSARPGEYTLFALLSPNFDDDFVRKHAAEGRVLKAEEKHRYSVVLHLVRLEER